MMNHLATLDKFFFKETQKKIVILVIIYPCHPKPICSYI